MASKLQGVAGYFSSSNRRGEIAEWREALNSDKEAARKDAVKKVIAAMTVGKDVSSLFSDVVKCVQTHNIELKKLVYLYIMYYAKSEPDLAILAVNTFDTDSKHLNPLIRGLAVRTMGCIRVNKIVEYLAEPLRRTLKDKDPYVRKTAAVAIAKLFDLNSELAIEQGFIEALEELLSDDNPMVVANAVATLSEISQSSNEVNVEFNEKTLKTLLTALNECTEWGQIFILDSLCTYEPKSESEATQIADRVTPRLAHSNSGVVLSAAKVILKMMNYISNQTTIKNLTKKMSGPLVTLLNSEPEIQYVALRNIDLIVQKLPGILERDVKVFFCKYNDPIYVKLEKLEIMIKLVTERNIDIVLNEFKEYSTEVDVEFIRKSVRSIGRCAIKLEKAAQRCINTLLELIETKVNYVVQEAIIVIRDIFRKYPNKYEMIIGTLCQNLDTLDEPEAKAAMIWIIGEYADRIENSNELLEIFADTFHDESSQVQLQILTATVKLFLKLPSEGQALLQKVLNLATQESDNPDLRDRGYMYWRLLHSDAQAAKNVILSEKPTITDDSTTIPKQLLDELIPHIATLASVYHKPPELFVPDYNKKKSTQSVIQRLEKDEDEEDMVQMQEEQQEPEIVEIDKKGGILDLDDILGPSNPPAPAPAQQSYGNGTSQQSQGGIDDIFDFGTTTAPVAVAAPVALDIPQIEKKMLLASTRGSHYNGIDVSGALFRRNGAVVYDFTFVNTTSQPASGLAFKFNVNTFGLTPGGPLSVSTIEPKSTVEATLPITVGVPKSRSDKFNNVLQIAFRNSGKVSYFQENFNISVFFEETGKLPHKQFLTMWEQIQNEENFEISLASTNPDHIIQRMQSRNIFYVEKYQKPDAPVTSYYFSSTLQAFENFVFLFEIEVNKGRNTATLSVRSQQPAFSSLVGEEIKSLLGK